MISPSQRAREILIPGYPGHDDPEALRQVLADLTSPNIPDRDTLLARIKGLKEEVEDLESKVDDLEYEKEELEHKVKELKSC